LEKLDLIGKVAVIGIAKRLEEIYFPGDSVPIYLDKNSETLKLFSISVTSRTALGLLSTAKNARRTLSHPNLIKLGVLVPKLSNNC
ncbi:MAG TPA: hypothetical protein DEQ03_10255, partial [Marinilabiliales bacterium]|nr:hypothetical protein [Marinilabiliales bacterium]